MPVAAIIPAVIGAAGAIGGSLIGSKAAGKAADTQEQAALASIEEQKRQFDINQENMEPWLQTGQLGLSALAQGLGLGEQTGTGPVGYVAHQKHSAAAKDDLSGCREHRPLSEGVL